MALTEKHEAIWDERLGYHERKPRVVRCTCGWQSERDFDVRIKPAFAQHKRDAAARQGAPRQAEDGNADGQARHAGDRVEQLGAAVSVRQLTPASAGHAVRLVVDGPLWLDPADAHLIADALNAAALEAIHEDRAARHG